MAKVGIVMGSDSDMPVMAQAADILKKLGVDLTGWTSIYRLVRSRIFSLSMQSMQRTEGSA